MTSPEDGSAEAIAELRELDRQPTSGFFARVQRSVERRRLAAETLDLSWTMVQVVVLEALEMVFQVFGRKQPDKGGDR